MISIVVCPLFLQEVDFNPFLPVLRAGVQQYLYLFFVLEGNGGTKMKNAMEGL